MAAPKGFAALAIVVAIAHPDSPYQLPDIIAGAFNMNGYPNAQNTYPIMTQLKLSFTKDLTHIPRIVSMQPMLSPTCDPYLLLM